MTLGESIGRLRKEKRMSQEELAERLEVSRQAVSKWETGGATPEVDKLRRMSEVFGVTLDELITGEKSEEEKAAEMGQASAGSVNEKSRECAYAAPHFETRKITGTVLFCLAALFFLVFTVTGGILTGIIFASPFLLCGAICFIFKKHIGLWCSWALYFAVDMYMSYATALNRANILRTFSWTYDMNYTILVLSWVSFLLLVALVVCTAVSFKGNYIGRRKTVITLAFCALAYLLSKAAGYFLMEWLMAIQLNPVIDYGAHRKAMSLYRLCSFALGWLEIIAATVAAVVGLAAVLRKISRQ